MARLSTLFSFQSETLPVCTKPLLGITFLCVGVAILLGLDHWLEGQILDILPEWLQDFSVSI
jgi:cytochrome c-type biogenesis protein